MVDSNSTIPSPPQKAQSNSTATPGEVSVPPPPPPPPPVAAVPPPPPPPGAAAGTSVTALPLPASVVTAAAVEASVSDVESASLSDKKKIRDMHGYVVDVVRRTHDTSTLYIFLGEDQLDYHAGQFVSVDPHQFEDLKRWVDYYEYVKGKKEVVRAYSMSSIPSEKCISITVKAEPFHAGHDKYPPLLSPFLVSGDLKGKAITVRGYSGHYVIPDDVADKTDQVLHLVAGSGVVPNYALIKDEMKRQDGARAKVKHTFVFTNKTMADVILHDQIRKLADLHPDRLDVHFLITREDPTNFGPRYRKGRPTTEWIRTLVHDPSSVLVYACGAAITKWDRQRAKESGVAPTPRFMESVNDILADLGVDKGRLKKEVFG